MPAKNNDRTKVETVLEEILPTEDGETPEDFLREASGDILRSRREEALERGEPLPNVDTSNLMGRTFIDDPDEEGVQVRAKIVDIMATDEETAEAKEQLYRFRCQVGDRSFEEIMTYNKMLEWCDRDLKKDNMFKLDGILKHRKNPKSGRKHDVLVRWASGQVTWNELRDTFDGDPITVAVYAKANNLLNVDGSSEKN